MGFATPTDVICHVIGNRIDVLAHDMHQHSLCLYAYAQQASEVMTAINPQSPNSTVIGNAEHAI